MDILTWVIAGVIVVLAISNEINLKMSHGRSDKALKVIEQESKTFAAIQRKRNVAKAARKAA